VVLEGVLAPSKGRTKDTLTSVLAQHKKEGRSCGSVKLARRYSDTTRLKRQLGRRRLKRMETSGKFPS